ncbi:amino acid permease [Priestia filamentosa]|uniref:amino acid permease n=1 Tax=Priestia filamentosa TaxID=1402861 RepID=UPI000A08C1E4|nr:amino acid permease [Priestia filamentosa]MDT3766103.1 amino acid permease [Priestia filamentosa]OXS65162.1 amino acid permease [Priestia filamentosa]WRU97932.1 amino acid permease [Priestia filamentosa]SMF70851.1 amino acid/polyamine/organocation transporter, APC superfamily [Priestia filamentosa]
MSDLLKKKSITQLLKQGESKTLEKTMGAFDLTLLGIGAVIGTGVLVLTGLVAANDAGPSVIISFILAAIVCGFAALCYAEFASTLPVSGSVYTYTYATIGEAIAHLMGWTLLSVYILTTATVASGWSSYFNQFLEGFNLGLPKELVTIPADGGIVNLPAIMITLLITWLLSRGTKESKKVNNFMVLVKLVVIGLFVIVGAFYVKPENWTPFAPFGIEGIMAGSAAVFFAFLGFDALSTSAEEVKNPQRDLPIGIIASLVVCTIIYVLVCLVMTGVVPYTELNVPEAMAYVLHAVGQDAVAGIVTIGAIIGIMAVIFAYIYAATRVLFSMSRDGLLPKSFSKTNEKTGAPVFSTWLIGIISSVIGGVINLKELSNLANIGALLTFGMVGVGIIILRKTHPNLERGFRVPLVPVLPLVSCLCCLFLMVNLPGSTWLYFSGWLVLGIVVYFGYSRHHSKLQKGGETEEIQKQKAN